jgi:RNA polymerase sigma-70 factor (ECF subfamily)
VIYCIVATEVAGELHEGLRRFFSARQDVEVVVERRGSDRRTRRDRRVRARQMRRERRASARRGPPDRRARALRRPAVELPAFAAQHRRSISFVELGDLYGTRAEDLDSARLVRLAKAGDPAAFDALYLRYYDRVYSQLSTLLGDRHDAEDATQEVFAKMHAALAQYQESRAAFHTWLFAIARNTARDRMRRPDPVPDDAHAILLEREQRERPDPAPIAPEDLFDRDVLRIAEMLPRAQRQVLYLRFVCDWTQQETAGALGKSPDAVRMLEKRALRFLKDRLEPLRANPLRRQRMPMWVVLKPLPVLRRRRFALAHDPQRPRRR